MFSPSICIQNTIFGHKMMVKNYFEILPSSKKKYTDIFKSGGKILCQSATKCWNKLFIIKFPLKWENLIIKNLFQSFEALWSKILPPDLKTSVYFFLLTVKKSTLTFLSLNWKSFWFYSCQNLGDSPLPPYPTALNSSLETNS